MKKAVDISSCSTPAGVIEVMLEKQGLYLAGFPEDAMGCTLDSAQGIAGALSERLVGRGDLVAERLGFTLINQLEFMDTLYHAVLFEVDRLEKEVKALKGEKA